MTNDPDWAKVLQFLQEQNGYYRRELTDEESDSEDYTAPQVAERKLAEDLCEELDVNDDREYMRELMAYLDNTLGFIQRSKNDKSASIRLEPDGFEVAHSRELTNRQDRTNSALVVFTFALVIVGVIGNIPDPRVRIIGGIVVLLFLSGIVIWTDILDLPSL